MKKITAPFVRMRATLGAECFWGVVFGAASVLPSAIFWGVVLSVSIYAYPLFFLFGISNAPVWLDFVSLFYTWIVLTCSIIFAGGLSGGLVGLTLRIIFEVVLKIPPFSFLKRKCSDSPGGQRMK